MMPRSRGFTLIELLVVIAIIGLLSSIVLASLSTARGKGSDAAIQSDLHSVMVEAEVYASTNGKYGNNASAQAGCNTAGAGTMFDPGLDPTMIRILSAIGGFGPPPLCAMAAGGSAWAVSARLVSDTTKYWCVDSTGATKQETRTISQSPPETACP